MPGSSLSSPASALLAGFAADLVAGDPARWHPVAGFGRSAAALERVLYAPSRARGVALTGTMVGAAAICGELLARALAGVGWCRQLALAVVVWIALGGRSLRREGVAVGELIERGELDRARVALGSLCGRDAASLDATGLCRAVVESLAENTGDAVVGALVWGALAGPAGAAAYRAANTLDAMVGHRNERYGRFGWAAARLDDAMSWPAARLGAALACFLAPLVGGSPRRAAKAAWRDAVGHPSPNAGLLEGAFAGALDVSLGGGLAYGGYAECRPELGDGPPPRVCDVHRAARLSLAVGLASCSLCALAASLRGAAFGRVEDGV